jgi:hypothetical protein
VSPGKARRAAAAVAALALVVTAVLGMCTGLDVRGATLRSGRGPGVPVALPYSTTTAPGQVLEFELAVHKGALARPWVVFVPDDNFVSLSVGGREIPLAGVSPGQRHDYREGFRFPLGASLPVGDSRVVVRVENGGGPGGLDVKRDWSDGVSRAELVVAALAFVVLIVAGMASMQVPTGVTALFALGTLLRFAYLDVTPSWLRAHDDGGHVEYIEYILRHAAIPAPNEGWSFYQPPLYYVLSAGLWKLLTAVGVSERGTILRALQIESFVFQLGFLGFSLATASLWMRALPDAAFGRRLASRSGLRALVAALVCLWPSAVIDSARIGNDDLFYLLYGAGFYFATRWWLSGRDRDLTLAAAWGAFAMATKTNALLLFAILGALLASRFVLDDGRGLARKLVLSIRRAWPMTVLFVVSAGLALGRGVVYAAHGKRANVLVGNAEWLRADLAVGNRAYNYLWFDVKTFVTQPFTSAFDDTKGRQFFWNFAIKSSLFGEFGFDSPRALSVLGILLSVLLLCLLAWLLVGTALRRARREDWYADLPLLVATVTLVASLAAFRMSIPKACSGDFRYILPVVAPMVCLFVRSVTLQHQRGWARAAMAACFAGWSFAACSVAFFVVLAASS